MNKQPFVCTLTAQESYRLGDPIIIRFEIRNVDHVNYQLLTWGTPLDNSVVNSFLVQQATNTLAYDGRFVKRGNPSKDDYLTIASSRSITKDIDISLYYPITQPGEYSVSLMATSLDVFPITTKKLLSRTFNDHQPHSLGSAIVHFKVITVATETDAMLSATPGKTLGQLARDKEKEEKQALMLTDSAVNEPNFKGATETERAYTYLAHKQARHFAAGVERYLRITNNSNFLYQEWFGTFNTERYNAVIKHYSEIDRVLQKESMTYDFTDPEGIDDGYNYAYTYFGVRTIYLCRKKYQTCLQIGIDSKFGVLIHELGHAIYSTINDAAYKEVNCRNLAKTSPDLAIYNADSHEYLSEHFALGQSVAPYLMPLI